MKGFFNLWAGLLIGLNLWRNRLFITQIKKNFFLSIPIHDMLKLSSYHSKASDWCRALSAASLFYNTKEESLMMNVWESSKIQQYQITRSELHLLVRGCKLMLPWRGMCCLKRQHCHSSFGLNLSQWRF